MSSTANSEAKIVIVDYGMGNLGSIQNMLKFLEVDSIISGDPAVVGAASKLILPGVGAFDTGMENIKEKQLQEVLNQKALKEKIPILGICLGMQLMTQKSEEGKLPGLGWLRAETIKFNFPDKDLKIPHMGWNTVEIKKETPLVKDLPKESRYYFVHSYHVVCEDSKDILLQTDYGLAFTSAFEHENIIGVQFHPEKSHKFGMKLFANFAKNYPSVKG